MLRNWQIHLCVKCKTIFKYFSVLLDFAVTANDANFTLRLLNGSSPSANVYRTARSGAPPTVRYPSLDRRAAKESMAHFSICPPGVRARSLAEHINPPGFGAFWNHLFTVGAGALRGQRSALGHSYRHNPGALSPPSVCSLSWPKVKAHTVGERDFPQFSGHWTLNNAVLVGLACAIFHPQLIPPHRTTPSLAFVVAASAEAESRKPFQPFPFFFFFFFSNDWNSLLNTMVAISFAVKCDLRVS